MGSFLSGREIAGLAPAERVFRSPIPTRMVSNGEFTPLPQSRAQREGADHVFWGTDSVWYGSPQWQIEAFRRLEIPEDMRRKHGFAPLGPADGPVKSAILGGNGARHYKVERCTEWDGDGLGRIKSAYLRDGQERSLAAYGYVVPKS